MFSAEQMESYGSLAALPIVGLICLALIWLVYQIVRLFRNGKDKD